MSDGTPILRRLLGESAVYGLGGVANRAFAILLVPIYARALGTEDYGIVALLTTTLTVTSLVATLALPQAFFRAYLKEARDAAEREDVLRTMVGLRLVTSVLAAGILLALSVPLAAIAIGDAGAWPLTAVLAAIVGLDTLAHVPLSLLRAERRPRPYAALTFGRAVLGSLLAVGFVVIGDLGPMGVVLGSAVSAMVLLVVGFGLLFGERRIGVGLDARRARSMLAFGLPLVPASLAGWVLNLSDRYFVNAFDGPAAVGVYAAGSTVGLAINALAVAPFTLAWGAAYWEIARRDDARAVIGRVLTGFAGLASFGALALSALATDAFRVLLTPEFDAGRYVTPFAAFASVGYGLFTILTTGINLEGRTRQVPLIVGLAAVANVVLNLALIPLIGPMGAALSTLLSYALLAAVGGAASQRIYAVPWDLGRVGILLGLAMALAAAALLGPDHVGWRLACIAAYPAVVLGLGIMSRRTAVELLRLLRRGRAPTRPPPDPPASAPG